MHNLLPARANTDVQKSNLEYQNYQARDLWRDLKKDKAKALEELFRFYYATLFDYGLKLCGHQEVVKDSIQETFAYIWEKRANLAIPSSVKAYLLVAMRRNVFKSLETLERRQHVLQQYELNQPEESFSAEELIIMTEITASAQQKLKRALKQIPERMREALYLKTYSGLDYSEISSIMGISPQVARNYVCEALSRLRSFVADS